MYNSFLFFVSGREASNNYIGLGIGVGGGATVKLTVKGENTFNSNGFAGFLTGLPSNNNLEINVEKGSTLETCGNAGNDIGGNVFANAAATFSGDGYTCDRVSISVFGTGTVDEPVCQACPSN